MSDGLDRIVALKKSILFLILSKLLKMYFFLISSNYINTGTTFDLLMRQKIFYGKDNEANACRSNYIRDPYVGWTNAFIFATFSQH